MSPFSRIKKLYAFLGASFFTGVLGLIMIQERLIFFPEKLPQDHVFHFSKSVEKQLLFEKSKISTLYFPFEESQTLILYFHGNAGSLDNWGYVGSELRDKLGVNVWVIDYPGFGKSEGSLSSERQLLDLAEAFYAQAMSEFPQKKIVVYGRSIGSGPAAWVASKYHLALVLETPYSSFSKLASEIAPWFPSFLRRYSFEVDTWLKGFVEPLLIVHGTQDEVIPYAHSERLALQLNHAMYVKIKEAAHNNLSEYEDYWRGIETFFKALP